MLLDNGEEKLSHHASGMFTAPTKGTAFVCDDEKTSHDILQIDARFEKLVKWLGENHIMVKLSGASTDKAMPFIKFTKPAVA